MIEKIGPKALKKATELLAELKGEKKSKWILNYYLVKYVGMCFNLHSNSHNFFSLFQFSSNISSYKNN